MRRWTMLVVAVGLVLAFGTCAYAQTPGGSGDKMEKDKMEKMEKDKMEKMEKDKMMDKKMDKKDDKMMDKKQ